MKSLELSWLEQASALFVHFRDSIQADPLLAAMLVAIGWAFGQVPWATLLPKVWRAMPWQRVALPDAAAFVLARTEATVIAMMARRRGKSDDDILQFIASYIAHNAPVSGFRPPAREYVLLTQEEMKGGGFSSGGTEFRTYGSDRPTLTNLTIRRWRQRVVVLKLRLQHKKWCPDE